MATSTGRPLNSSFHALAALPIIFLVFTVPYLTNDIYYSLVTSPPKEVLVAFGNIFISLWSMASAATLIVHIAVAQLPAYCRRKLRTRAYEESSLTYMLHVCCIFNVTPMGDLSSCNVFLKLVVRSSYFIIGVHVEGNYGIKNTPFDQFKSQRLVLDDSNL